MMRLDLPRAREFGAGVWYSTYASTWYPAHYHEELELKLVLCGDTNYRIGSENVLLGAGTLLWLWPGQEHAVLHTSADLAMWVASFRVELIRAAELASGHRQLGRERGWYARALSLSHARKLSVAYAAMSGDSAEVVNVRAVELLTRAFELSHPQTTTHGLESLAECSAQAWHPAVMRARALLAECRSDVSIASLARQCGAEPARLSRLFRQQMGLAPVQFRNHVRVQRFIAGLARADGRNMLQAALDAGFGSYPQFHRAFHQVTGYAPSEHLRRVRAGLVFPVCQSASAPSTAEQQTRDGQE